MTQHEFASQMLQIVDNSRNIDGKSNEDIVSELKLFLSVLEPKDRVKFAKWGHPPHQVVESKCWD